MIISAIVAASENGVIGLNNQIPWHLPADLRYFKKITTGHHLLMGRKCFDSIGKPLHNRTNMILTRNHSFLIKDTVIVHSLHQAFQLARDQNESELFIIGGAEIYEATLPHCERLYFNTVHVKLEGDTYWPKMNWKDWSLISVEYFPKDNLNVYPLSFSVFERKK